MDTRADDGTDEALRALAEPRRRAIVRVLAAGELPVGRLAERFDVTRGAISQHLRVLEDAGLVTHRRDGTRHLYRTRPDGLVPLRRFLEETWADSLDAARRVVEQEAGTSDDEEQRHERRTG